MYWQWRCKEIDLVCAIFFGGGFDIIELANRLYAYEREREESRRILPFGRW